MWTGPPATSHRVSLCASSGPEPAAASSTSVLRAILRRCRADRRADDPPVVVFDLDGTLMDNRPRTVAILREFATRYRDRDPDLAAPPRRGPAAATSTYLLTDSLERLGAHRTELVAEMQAFWRDRFFADPHLVHDVALPGAVEFVRACYDAGAMLVYLTGRDLPLMGTGTFAQPARPRLPHRRRRRRSWCSSPTRACPTRRSSA